MAQYLDPKLQRIIADASTEVLPSDTPHSILFPEDFTDTTINRYLDRHQPRVETSFRAIEFQTAHSILHDFDGNILRSNNTSRRFIPNDNHSRLPAPSSTPYKSSSSVKTDPRAIYANQITRLPLGDDTSSVLGLPVADVRERQQRPQVPQHDPVAIFHGIEKANSTPLLPREPATPFNHPSHACDPLTQIVVTPSSINETPSPSNRVSLRRKNNRSLTLSVPKRHQSHLDADLLLCTPPQRESIASTARTDNRPNLSRIPPTVQGIQLVSPHDLPDKFRQVFPYELFNAVQSKCFAAIYRTNDNIIIAAPTGSGKTAILELAICKLVQEYGSGQFKIVYQAPTKSLCSERARDWEKKFSHLNLSCAELTGDTDAFEMRKVATAAIIVTTPEKWDSITRKWKDYIRLLQLVKLFLIDEVHILKDIRGATLEAVVSRMKSIGASVRFVALSATVPNSHDIATWLGKDHTNHHLPAHRETFGEEFRPVKLQKHVYGFGGNSNDFAFDNILDAKLPSLIAKHTVRKPMMIFCITRKICEATAAKLAEWWTGLRVTERPWPIPQQKVTVGSPELRELIRCGVAFHHAGLDPQDRTAVETGFLNDGLSVICCTSTLAVGVNLPCQLVVIKNTVCYTDTGLSEYSDLEVMQMLGRAGRPQFDNSATGIIMTRSEKAERYRKMISGQDILESTLHLNLIEHLNSEISLGTVHDIYSAKHWLAGTFLSVRVRQNPTHYKFSCDTGTRDADERLEGVCERDIELLKNTKLITKDQRFTCTEYGQAMSRYMVQFETMKLLLSIPKHANMTQILHIISQAAEFKDFRLKPNERPSYRDFNKSPFIKAPIKENISAFAHKVSLIIQIHLGGVDLPMDKDFNIIKRQFMSEKVAIFDRALRLVRCVVECKAYDCDAVATCNALDLLRSVAAGFWENSPLQLRQIPGIGPAAMRKLAQSNIKTVGQLASMDMAAIERAMSRNPPFGKKILDLMANFPWLTLRADIMNILKSIESVKVIVKAQLGYSNIKLPVWNRKAPTVVFTASDSNGGLAHIWRGPIKRLERGYELAFTCRLLGPSDTITCQLACEEIVGTIQFVELKPNIPALAFPPPEPSSATPRPTPVPDRDQALIATEIGTGTTAAIEESTNASITAPGSDYGGDSIFDEFVDIEEFEKDTVSHDGEPEPLTSIPVRMENGKWRCNHKCRDVQGNYLTKNGIPCRHRCCREGLEKPRKLQKKPGKVDIVPKELQKTKLNREKHPKIAAKVPVKVSRAASKHKLRLADQDMNYNDIEELDLAGGPLTTEGVDTAPPEYRTMPGVLSLEGKPGSVRISKSVPKFSYASGSQPNLSFIRNVDCVDESDTEFPSPSSLLGGEEILDYATIEYSNDFSTFSHNNDGFPEGTGENPQFDKILENGASDLNALEESSQAYSSISNKKRPASPGCLNVNAKCQRVLGDEEVPPEAETKRALPEWVNEFDADLVAYFEDVADFK